MENFLKVKNPEKFLSYFESDSSVCDNSCEDLLNTCPIILILERSFENYSDEILSKFSRYRQLVLEEVWRESLI